ncbi:F-box domain containing membrane protein [Entamoeba marina]
MSYQILDSENQNFQLPIEVIKKISIHSDLPTFVNLCSTCKEYSHLLDDTEIYQQICKADADFDKEQCIKHYRKYDNYIKKENMRYNSRKALWEKYYKRNWIMCGLRCSGNILLDNITLIITLIFIVLYPLSLDRTIDVSTGTLSLILLFPILYIGVMPYIIYGQLLNITINHKEMASAEFSDCFFIDKVMYIGSITLFNILEMSTVQYGLKILQFGVIDITYLLFVLYCYEVLSFGYIIIPMCIYSFLTILFGCLQFNLLFHQKKNSCKLSICNTIHCVVIDSIIFPITLIFLLKSFNVISFGYIYCIIPLIVILLMIPFFECTRALILIYLLLFKYGNINVNRNVNDRDHDKYKRLFGIDDEDILIWCCRGCEMCCYSPLIISFVVLISLALDSLMDIKMILVFIPLIVLICLYACCSEYFSIQTVVTCGNSNYFCCPLLCPDYFGSLKEFCCCPMDVYGYRIH